MSFIDEHEVSGNLPAEEQEASSAPAGRQDSDGAEAKPENPEGSGPQTRPEASGFVTNVIKFPGHLSLQPTSEEVFGSYRIHGAVRAQFEIAVRGTQEAAREKVRVNEVCWRSNASIYALGCNSFWNAENKRTFCGYFGITCTGRTLGNDFLPFVKAAHQAAGCLISDKDASRYARALKYMKTQDCPPERAFEFLRTNGGIDGCLRMASRAARRAPKIREHNEPETNGVEAADVAENTPSPTEWSLIRELRGKGLGKFICRVVRDQNGMQSFSIEADVERESIASPQPLNTETEQKKA